MFDAMKQDENNLNLREHQLRQGHFQRLTERHEKATMTTSLFVDILGTLERIGDHAFNVGRVSIDPIKTHMEKEEVELL